MRPLLIQLFSEAQETSYASGDTILRANDKAERIHFIASGWVKAYQTDWQHGEKILTTLAPGDIFPCTWSVEDISNGVNFGTLDATTTLSMPVAKFQEIAAGNPGYTRELLHAFSQRLHTLTDEITNLQYRNAREKVILRLLSLAEIFGQQKNGQTIIHKHISNEYIARSTSMSRETTSREMSRLARERLIRHTASAVAIPDIAKLRHQVSDQGCAPDYSKADSNKPSKLYAIRGSTM